MKLSRLSVIPLRLPDFLEKKCQALLDDIQGAHSANARIAELVHWKRYCRAPPAHSPAHTQSKIERCFTCRRSEEQSAGRAMCVLELAGDRQYGDIKQRSIKYWRFTGLRTECLRDFCMTGHHEHTGVARLGIKDHLVEQFMFGDAPQAQAQLTKAPQGHKRSRPLLKALAIPLIHTKIVLLCLLLG